MTKRAEKKRARKSGASALDGNVLDVVRALLETDRKKDVLDVVTQLVTSNSDLATKNAELERRLAQLLTRGFKNNEGVSKEQLLLFLNALMETGKVDVDGGADAADAAANAALAEANQKLQTAAATGDAPKDDEPATKPAKQPPARKPLPPNLPRVDNLIKVPAQARPCPVCGVDRVCIGHDVTEVWELKPAELFIRRDMREKLACNQCDGGEMVRAPLGDKVVSGGMFGSRLVSVLLVDKYDDGLPLHRQKDRFARMGVDFSVSTLADQVTWATDLLKPVWRAAIAEVLGAKVMHLDATGLPVQDREVEGALRLGTLWGYVGDTNVAAYLYTSTGKRHAQRPQEVGPADMLALRSGLTVADASNLFDTSFKRPDLIECGCNTHARRYFVKALDAGDTRAALPIAAYKKLYEIEAELSGLEPSVRVALRQEQSLPVWSELVSWCETYKAHEPPASMMGKAIRYLLNNRLALARFIEFGEVPIDNSIVERLHVRAALTRKNFLFAGSDAGGERAAIAFTILSCCRLVGIDPVEYLADVLPRLAQKIRLRDVPALLPANWKAARAGPVNPA